MSEASFEDDTSMLPTSASKDESIEYNYKLCCLYNAEENKCGPCTRYRSTKYGLVPVENLNSDVENHLRNLRYKDSLDLLLWSERKLIENRIGHELPSGTSICEFHRYKHGVGWYQVQHCAQPDHPPYKPPAKTKKTTLAPMFIIFLKTMTTVMQQTYCK